MRHAANIALCLLNGEYAWSLVPVRVMLRRLRVLKICTYVCIMRVEIISTNCDSWSATALITQSSSRSFLPLMFRPVRVSPSRKTRPPYVSCVPRHMVAGPPFMSTHTRIHRRKNQRAVLPTTHKLAPHKPRSPHEFSMRLAAHLCWGRPPGTVIIDHGQS